MFCFDTAAVSENRIAGGCARLFRRKLDLITKRRLARDKPSYHQNIWLHRETPWKSGWRVSLFRRIVGGDRTGMTRKQTRTELTIGKGKRYLGKYSYSRSQSVRIFSTCDATDRCSSFAAFSIAFFVAVGTRTESHPSLTIVFCHSIVFDIFNVERIMRSVAFHCKRPAPWGNTNQTRIVILRARAVHTFRHRHFCSTFSAAGFISAAASYVSP